MDLQFLLQYGYIGLFLACFLASTFLPLASETIVIAMSLMPDINIAGCLIVATIANTLGGMTCYAFGRIGKVEWLVRFFKADLNKVHRWERRIKKYGTPLTFFSFLPFVGDIISTAAGFVRTPILPTVILMTLGRCGRYAVLLYTAGVLKTTVF